MTDILIRGMEMPKTCVQCDLKIYDPEKRWNENGIEQIGAWVCKRTGEIIWNTQRGENCPLVPLPRQKEVTLMLRKLINRIRKRRFCKANRWYCPECIYHEHLFDGFVYRGVRCHYPEEGDDEQ